MAVLASANDSNLRVVVQTGLDQKGNPELKTRSYNNIQSNVSDEDLYTLADLLAGLQIHPLVRVNRVNHLELTEV